MRRLGLLLRRFRDLHFHVRNGRGMQLRRLAGTGLRVSAVGFGTCQLRLVSEQCAIDTLKRGFDLGVNVVHTAPDYEGADALAAQAIQESGRDIMVFSQGYGDMAHFEWLFETTCRKFRKHCLEMFGIACIDDREHLGEDVWGPNGMVEFLQEKKREGRLRGIFCSTHGTPEYITRLVTSGVFDAVMLTYNPLGFHLLSYFPESPRAFENVPMNRELFPLAARYDVGLIIMKPLAGGFLCAGKAFPPRANDSHANIELTARDILRSILLHPEVSCVVPGTASMEEAEENARAGYLPMEVPRERLLAIQDSISRLRVKLCSRCGLCESQCSKNLPISWLFRDAYINTYPSETFETIDQLRYFHLHPNSVAVCSTCVNRSCSCPSGIDIPAALTRVHDQMLGLRERGLLPATPNELLRNFSRDSRPATVVSKEIPTALCAGQRAMCRLYLENSGRETWLAVGEGAVQKRVVLEVSCAGEVLRHVPVRHNVEPGCRTHFAFEVEAPKHIGTYLLRFALMLPREAPIGAETTEILTTALSVLPKPFPADGLETETNRCIAREDKSCSEN